MLLAAAASVAEEKIEIWADSHPSAAFELGEWMNSNRAAARAFIRWDSTHPEQTRSFVTWVTTHQGKGIDVFASEHTDWNRFNEIIKEHRSAVVSFIVWCRFHPTASAALMRHPRALHWEWKHVFKSIYKAKEQ